MEWSYPSGEGTWNGIFYPARGRGNRPRGFDELVYYAEHFNTVEVNSTFYRPPSAAVTRRWVERTPSDFVFSLKLHQQFTHPKMFQAATGAATWSVGQPDVDRSLLGLDPIASAGKLGVLLAQFPSSGIRRFENWFTWSPPTCSRRGSTRLHGQPGPSLSYIDDPHPRAQRGDGATTAGRVDWLADVLAPRHQI